MISTDKFKFRIECQMKTGKFHLHFADEDEIAKFIIAIRPSIDYNNCSIFRWKENKGYEEFFMDISENSIVVKADAYESTHE